MSRTLSSAWTLFYKLLPVTLTGAFVLAVRKVQEARDLYSVTHSSTPPVDLLLLGVVMIAGIVVSVVLCAPLKRVRVGDDGESLLISNYIREWTLPVGLIAEVTQHRWLKLRPITIHLRIDPGCGTRVAFMPPLRLNFRFWREDPEVEELRTLASAHVPV